MSLRTSDEWSYLKERADQMRELATQIEMGQILKLHIHVIYSDRHPGSVEGASLACIFAGVHKNGRYAFSPMVDENNPAERLHLLTLLEDE